MSEVKTSANVIITNDDVRAAAEIILGENSNTSKYVAWNGSLAAVINMCMRTHFMKEDKTTKSYRAAVHVIRTVVKRMDNTQMWEVNI